MLLSIAAYFGPIPLSSARSLSTDMVTEPPSVAFSWDDCPRQAYLNMPVWGKPSRPRARLRAASHPQPLALSATRVGWPSDVRWQSPCQSRSSGDHGHQAGQQGSVQRRHLMCGAWTTQRVTLISDETLEG